MVRGIAPAPHELPYLLTLAQQRQEQQSGDKGAAKGAQAQPSLPAHPLLPLTSRLMACYAVLCECAAR